MKKIIVLFIFLLSITLSFAQRNAHRIDSITVLLNKATSDSLIVRHHLELGILKDKIIPLEAEQHLKTAIKQLKANYSYADKLEQLALAYDCLGIIERRRSNYDSAYAYYLNALRIKELDKDTLKIGRSYHNIAMLFAAKQDYNKAITYIKKALPIRKQQPLNYATSLNNYGYFLYKTKQYKAALSILDSAKLYYGNHLKAVDVNKTLAKIYVKQKQYDKALNIQKETLNHFIKHEQPERMANILKDLAVTSRKRKQYPEALKYLERAQKIAERYGSKKLIAVLYKERYRISKNKNNFKQALQHYQTYKTYEDSVFTSAQTSKIKQLELEYNYDKKLLSDSLKFQAKTVQLKTNLKNQRTQKYLYAILFFVALLVLISIFILYRYRRKIEKQNRQQQTLETDLLNEKIDFLRFKIERLLADNKMRTNFNKELSQRIKTLSNKKSSNTLIDEYQSILVKLNNQVKTEKRLDTVSETLLDGNATFEAKLAEQFPKLTKSEREVCHFIYLNLSIKEIMNIRNVTLPSIKSTRYRIRKKLNVPKGEELELFLQRLF